MINAEHNSQPALKDIFRDDFYIGVALSLDQISGKEPDAIAVVEKHFNSITPENILKWEEVHPELTRYNFEAADRYVAFGEQHKMYIVGHTLVWYQQTPDWVFQDESGKPLTREALLERMKDHIFTVMGRYKGRIHGWDVVNEAFEDNGQYRNSKFYKILGKDFIKYAFRYAHEADPKAELYYNDYNVENPAKCDAIVGLVKELRAAGCRIDAVGSQSHMHMNSPTLDATETSLKKLKAAGVKILITEWDISILPSPFEGAEISKNFTYSKEMDPYREAVPDSVQQKWNKRILDMFGLFLKYNDAIDRVTIWGLTDNTTWLNNFPIHGRKDYPVIFDRNNQRKSVVDEMIKLAEKYK